MYVSDVEISIKNPQSALQDGGFLPLLSVWVDFLHINKKLRKWWLTK